MRTQVVRVTARSHRIDDRHAESAQATNELWFVLRFSGRAGERVRVVYESRSHDQAERFYLRKAFPKKRRRGALEYATTILCHGNLDWWRRNEAIAGGYPFGSVGNVERSGRVMAEREQREARAELRDTRRARRRLEVVPEALPAGVMDLAAFRVAHPAERHRDAGGVYFTHAMAPGEAFAKERGAVERGHGIYLAQIRMVEPVPPRRLRIAIDDEADARAAEHEAAAVEQAAGEARAS